MSISKRLYWNFRPFLLFFDLFWSGYIFTNSGRKLKFIYTCRVCSRIGQIMIKT
jgi:hypothetical protein